MSVSRDVSRDRLSSGFGPFDGSGPCGFTSAATPRHRRLQGFLSLLTPSTPPRASPECFVRVHPWGFVPPGFPFVRIANVSRRTPYLVSFGTLGHEPLCVLRLQVSPAKAVTRRGLLRRLRAAARLLGLSPLQGFQPDRSPRFRGRPHGLCGVRVFGPNSEAPQGNQPAGRPRPPRERSESTLMRFAHLVEDICRFGRGRGLAMCSLGVVERVAAFPCSVRPRPATLTVLANGSGRSSCR